MHVFSLTCHHITADSRAPLVLLFWLGVLFAPTCSRGALINHRGQAHVGGSAEVVAGSGPSREHRERAACYSMRAALLVCTWIPSRCFEDQGSALPGAAPYSIHWSGGQRGQYVATLSRPSALGSLGCPHVSTCACVFPLSVQCVSEDAGHGIPTTVDHVISAYGARSFGARVL